MAQELNIRLDPEDKKPLYRQIYEYIRGEIRSGGLEAGERLPSTRSLASGLHVARSTTELAYSQLLSEAASPCCFACTSRYSFSMAARMVCSDTSTLLFLDARLTAPAAEAFLMLRRS